MKLIEKYNKQIEDKITEIKKIQTFADEAGVDMTPDQSKQIDEILSQIDGLKKSVEQLKKVELVEEEVAVESSKKKVSAGRYSKPVAGVIHQDVQKFSLLRAIQCMVQNGKLDGLEAEVNQEYARKYNKSAKGFYLPLETFANLDATTTGAGGVKTIKDSDNFIELLRVKTLANTLGVKFLSDLDGNISVPKQTGGGTAYWINSDGSANITISNQSVGQVPLIPNTCGAYTNYTRQFVKQTGIDAEAFVRNDLASVLAIELDRVIFGGSGSGSEPEGVIYNSDVDVVALGVDGAAPTWASLVALETGVAADNADLGNLAYVTSPQGRGKLKSTVNSSNTAAKFLCENNECNGYKLYATNQLPHDLTKGSYGTALSPVIFGNWNDILVGMWGAPDVVVNPYTNDTYGSIKVTIMQELDVAIRHPESFNMILDMVTT